MAANTEQNLHDMRLTTPGPRESLYDISAQGRGTGYVPASSTPKVDTAALLGPLSRSVPPVLPEVGEVEISRHYAHLASMNFGVDTGMYPLGSCTMKYNPRINEATARYSGFADLHPLQPVETVQGALQLMYELAHDLCEISGFSEATLQPAAGAHGEYTALAVFRAAHTHRGNPRKKVILPDTAHGTNPASVAMCGYDVVTVPSDDNGLVDVEKLKELLDEDVAAFMLTNPNTVGIYEPHIREITEAVHAVGAYAYCDGANLNAILGVSRPGDVGFDALHINTHKTFSTPHGGGGPGAGPVCVTESLAPFLPGPIVVKTDKGYDWKKPDHSIGRVRSFNGNFGILVRAYTYIKAFGGRGLMDAGKQAVLNANYLRVLLQDDFDVAYDRYCMHEFVLDGSRLKNETGVSTLDVAKRLLDYGYHPPTVYFPLLVHEAIMIEPTETEPKKALDDFADAMKAIAREAHTNPELLHNAPTTAPLRRLDEAQAARHPQVMWEPHAKDN